MLIFIRTCSITAMIVCIFEHVQWRWALKGRLAHGCPRPRTGCPRRSRVCQKGPMSLTFASRARATPASAHLRLRSGQPPPRPPRAKADRPAVVCGRRCVFRELSWEPGSWARTTTRLAPLNEAFTAGLDGTHVRDPEYWASWMHAPAEALDAAGQPTPGVMRGFEVRAVCLHPTRHRRTGPLRRGCERMPPAAIVVTMHLVLELSGPLLESLTGKHQSFSRERSR